MPPLITSIIFTITLNPYLDRSLSFGHSSHSNLYGIVYCYCQAFIVVVVVLVVVVVVVVVHRLEVLHTGL